MKKECRKKKSTSVYICLLLAFQDFLLFVGYLNNHIRMALLAFMLSCIDFFIILYLDVCGELFPILFCSRVIMMRMCTLEMDLAFFKYCFLSYYQNFHLKM